MDIIFKDVTEADLKLIAEMFGPHCTAAPEIIPQATAELPPVKAAMQAQKEPTTKTIVLEPEGVPLKKTRQRHNFWKIPFIASKECAKYAAAIRICKKYDLPYPQAKEMWVKEHPEQKTNGNPIKHTDLNDPLSVVPGMKVRQVRPDAGRMFRGVAQVIARRGEMIEVRDSDGTTWKILQCHLEPANNGATQKAAMGAPA